MYQIFQSHSKCCFFEHSPGNCFNVLFSGYNLLIGCYGLRYSGYWESHREYHNLVSRISGEIYLVTSCGRLSADTPVTPNMSSPDFPVTEVVTHWQCCWFLVLAPCNNLFYSFTAAATNYRWTQRIKCSTLLYSKAFTN